MQDVIEHCDTTLNNVMTEIRNDNINNIEENQFAEIKKAITTNQDSQIKNKKFYALKYNHKATHVQSQQTASESPVNPDLNNNTT